MESSQQEFGYCLITLTSDSSRILLQSNNERAFIITQLQDLLSPRLILGDVPSYRQLASCIDLLAFSLRKDAVELLVFSVDTTIATDFAQRVTARLLQYRSEYGSAWMRYPNVRVELERLSGPHDALAVSVQLHNHHEDWEYDRYSSIGFYLHDRRGDWMRIWRLARLYDHTPELYRSLLCGERPYQTRHTTLTAEPLAS